MTSTIACDLTAIASDQRAAHEALAERLFKTAQQVNELPNGYAFRFTADDYLAIVSFVTHERLCCPFFTFEVEVDAERGPIWLRLTGREGVKEYLWSELNR